MESSLQSWVIVKFIAAARAILQEDGKDPIQDLGPPVHSWGT
jgi:hypothetical protein